MNSRRRVIMMAAALLVGVAVWPQLHSHPVRAQSPSLTGSYGYVLNAPYAGGSPAPGLIQGVVTFDAAGNATSSAGISVGPDPDPNATSPKVRQESPNTGTYAVNSDGTGTMTFPNPGGTPFTLSFVMTDGGSQLMLGVTSGFGNTAANGIARKQ